MNQDHPQIIDITEAVKRVFKLKDNLMELRRSFSDGIGEDNRSEYDQKFIKKWLAIKENQLENNS